MNYQYVLKNFFTHKDNLLPAELIPGTYGTMTCYGFIVAVTIAIVLGAGYLAGHKNRIHKVFLVNWIMYLVWEIAIILYDTYAGETDGFDFSINLSLYPCSLYLYIMPFILWGKGVWKWMGCAYIATLGLVGGVINFIWPYAQMQYYSCFSFTGFHTIFYHGNILFTWLTLILSHEWNYSDIRNRREAWMACIPTLMLSIPANLMNYSPIQSDYMYFTGQFPLLHSIFPNTSKILITLFMYSLYIMIPPLFFIPGCMLKT